MSTNKEYRGEGGEISNPMGDSGNTNSFVKSFKKLISVSNGSAEDVYTEGNTSMSVINSDNQPRYADDAQANLYPLNSVQLATISILKAGLDQIAWEPLIDLLEDLAASGTVSRFKLHNCSTKVISRILGTDLESQVLQQFHNDPSKAEVIMIESLIFSYVQDLSTKKILGNQKQETKSNCLSLNEKNKRNTYSKEKRANQPSYQKTTESFRRKQRCKSLNLAHRPLQKRHLRQSNHHENKAADKSCPTLNSVQVTSSVTSQKNPSESQKTIDLLDVNGELNSGDQFYHNFSWSDTSEGNSKQQLEFTAVDLPEQSFRKENKTKRKGKRKVEDEDWDLVETETAIKAYEANNLTMRSSVGTRKLSCSVNNPIYSIEFTPSNNSRPNIEGNINTLVLKSHDNPTYEYCSQASDSFQVNNRYKNSNTVLKKDDIWLKNYEEEVSAPEKDVSDKGNDLCCSISSTDDLEATVGCDKTENTIPVTSKLIGDGDSCYHDYKKTNFFGNVFDSNSNNTNIIKVNAEKECSSFSNKTTITEFDETNKNGDHFHKNESDYTSVIKKNPSCDNLIALRISEELMNLLKEQFLIKKQFGDLTFDYHRDSEERLPYSELQKMRKDTSIIMKRLNLISSLTLLVLMSSVLTTTIFFFSSDNNFVQRTTLHFISQLFCGWCR